MMNEHESQSRQNLAAQWTKVYPIVSAYVHSLIFSFHDAEDVIQEVAITLAQRYDSYDPTREFVPWVLGIARHKALDHLRAQGRQNELFDTHSLTAFTQAFVAIEHEVDEMRSILDECMARLSDKSHRALRFRYLREMSVRDISRNMGLTRNAVYVVLHRAREALTRCIQRKTRVEWEA